MPCFESVTENWRYFRLPPNLDSFVKLANLIFDQGRRRLSRRNVYLVKIEAISFRDTGHCKDTESNLGPFSIFAGF